MMIVPLLFVALVVWLLVRAYDGRGLDFGTHRDRALEILRERYARGEISSEEFERMKKDLR